MVYGDLTPNQSYFIIQILKKLLSGNSLTREDLKKYGTIFIKISDNEIL
jgi:hypothetical protein